LRKEAGGCSTGLFVFSGRAFLPYMKKANPLAS